jgi:hypothetical protein
MTEPVRYPESLNLRLQDGVTAFVNAKAREIGTKPTEIARQALLAGLKSIGFDPSTIPARDAGALYDRRSDGKTRWPSVADGAVLDLSYFATNPNEMPDQAGRKWLPVRHEDSALFDIANHWRLKPEARVDGDKVTVVFPVVDKTWETA